VKVVGLFEMNDKPWLSGGLDAWICSLIGPWWDMIWLTLVLLIYQLQGKSTLRMTCTWTLEARRGPTNYFWDSEIVGCHASGMSSIPAITLARVSPFLG
jgi:hypothetical protein